MSRLDRNGGRKPRTQSVKRVPRLGYYFIVTDTEETEQNYMHGLRDSLPAAVQDNIVIKVVKAKTVDLIEKALSLAALNPQYSEIWIVFDRDRVKGFDDMISEAVSKGIHVGWSNPCIEIWFHAYFGSMPPFQTSVVCCKGFEESFEKRSGQKYRKDDKAIYRKLIAIGNEDTAISLAARRLNEHKRAGKEKPSEMCPCTTVYSLVQEIKQKTGG